MIEEIKERYPNRCSCRDNVTQLYPYISCPFHGIQIWRDVQTLLAELEKAERRVSELDGAIVGWKIVEKTLKEQVKQERERADKAEKKFSSIHWYQQYTKSEERARFWKEQYDKLEVQASQWEEDLEKEKEENARLNVGQ